MAEELCRITVPWDVNRLNPNRVSRLHWGKRAKLRGTAREAAAWGYAAAGRPTTGSPVDVELIVRRGRRLDDDNVIAALKAVRDVLFNGAITPDDSPRWVRLTGVTWEVGKQWKDQPEVVFVVRRRPGVVGGRQLALEVGSGR